MRSLSAIFACIALSGCAGDPKFVDASSGPPVTPLWMSSPHAAEKSCCTNIADLPFQELPLNQPHAVEVTSQTPFFIFPEGASRFVAYRLNETGAGARLQIKTIAVHGGWSQPSIVFYPYLTFLDNKRTPIATVEPRLQLNNTLMSVDWLADVEVPTEAEFVVIHTPKNKTATYLQTGRTPPGPTLQIGLLFKTLPSVHVDGIRASNAGRLEITYRRLTQTGP